MGVVAEVVRVVAGGLVMGFLVGVDMLLVLVLLDPIVVVVLLVVVVDDVVVDLIG